MAKVLKQVMYYDRDEVGVLTDSGEFVITLKDYYDLNLSDGDELDDEQKSVLLRKDEFLRCVKRLLATVSRTNISKRRLSLKFKYDFSPEALEYAIARLEKAGYLNDSEYAKRYAELYAKRLFGKRRISSELYKRGFESEDIDFALGELEIDEDEMLENMHELLEKRFSSKPFDKQKAYSTLYSRGYGSSEIKAAIDLYLDDEDFDDEDFF